MELVHIVMPYAKLIASYILHIDVYLSQIVRAYGVGTYLILLLVVFCETGLVVMPVPPGDSLLFAAGFLAAKGDLNPLLLFTFLSFAAVLGDSLNYSIGNLVGPKVFQRERIRFLKRNHLMRTHRFFEEYGGKTIVIARFVPTVRTFAPFVAGIGAMSYRRFIGYNIIGGIAWIATFVFAGYYFGNIPLVKGNFSLVGVTIIFISVVPGLVELVCRRRSTKRKEAAGTGCPGTCGPGAVARIEASGAGASLKARRSVPKYPVVSLECTGGSSGSRPHGYCEARLGAGTC